MKKKIALVITGSRAEYGLLRPVMRAITKSKKLSLRVLITGAHTLKKYGNTKEQVLADFPNAVIVPVSAGNSMTAALAKEIEGIGRHCAQERPDIIVVNGDRDESFAGAIVGGHVGIPVAHIHGGDKTGRVVDEYIRHATTKFSHLHFAATKKSAQRIKLLGEESWRIFTVGGPGLDEMRSFSFKSKKDIAKKYGLDPAQPWRIILHHPVPLDGASPKIQAAGLFRVVATLKGEKIISLPNADTGSADFLKEIETYRDHKNMHLFTSMPRKDFLNVFKYATLLIGNSSMGIIDSSFFRIPTVNVGSRQLGREQGVNVVHAGYDEASIRSAIKKATSPAFARHVARMKSPYGDGHAAEKIVQAIEQNINRPDLFHKKLTYV